MTRSPSDPNTAARRVPPLPGGNSSHRGFPNKEKIMPIELVLLAMLILAGVVGGKRSTRK